MRDELVCRLTVEEAALLQVALETLERWSAAKGAALSGEVAMLKLNLATFVGRAVGDVEATMRPDLARGPHDEDFMDSKEAARVLGLTVGAVAKRCRTGVFGGVARRERGRWLIPAADVLAMKGARP